MKNLIAKEEGTKATLNFDYLVIATGFTYDMPVKDKASLTITDREKGLKKLHGMIDEALNVLIVGGGIAAVELAGELKEKYKAKHIGICFKEDRLLHKVCPKAGILAEEYLIK